MLIVDGPNVGDPAAAAAIAGHWLAASAGSAPELDLAHAAGIDSTGLRPSSS